MQKCAPLHFKSLRRAVRNLAVTALVLGGLHSTAEADGLYVTTNGNVGVGTNTPGNYKLNVLGWLGVQGSTLDVLGGAGNAGLTLESTTLSQYDQFIRFKDPLGSWYVGQRWQYSLHDFGIGTDSGKNTLILTATGKAGIGVYPTATLDVYGSIRSLTIASAGSLCGNSAGDIVACGSSSMRYKENVQSFDDGASVIRKLRPVSFKWKRDATFSSGDAVGFLAEEVFKSVPQLAFKNQSGEVEGVHYDRIIPYAVSAIQEQQRQLTVQGEEIKALRKELAVLRESLASR